MKKIKLKERDIMRIVKRTIKESQKTKKKKTITVSESDLIKSIEQIVNEQNAVLGFGNQGGIGMGIALPSDKHKDLQEDEEEVDEQAKESEDIVGGKETVSVVDDPAATADGMGMFEEVKALKEKIYRLEKTLKKESQLRTLKTIKEQKKKKTGKCPESGCIKKEGKFWRIISNKTGKLWPAKYDTKKDAEDGLDAYHANR
jgi:hypothetical protein